MPTTNAINLLNGINAFDVELVVGNTYRVIYEDSTAALKGFIGYYAGVTASTAGECWRWEIEAPGFDWSIITIWDTVRMIFTTDATHTLPYSAPHEERIF